MLLFSFQEKVHEDRLSAITNSDLDLVFQKNTSTQLYIVVFPGNYFFGVIEPVLLEVFLLLYLEAFTLILL